MRSLRAWLGAGLFVAAAAGAAPAGEPAKPAPEPAPVGAEERKKLLDAETPGQKALREELKKAGGKIYFECKGQTWLVGLDGAPEKQVTSLEGGGKYPQVSPDGKRLLVVCDPPKEKLKEVEGRFLIKKLAEKSQPLDQRNMGTAVMTLVNIDGSDPKFVGYGWTPHWAPNGKQIAYSLNMKGARNRPICVADLEKGEEYCVTPPDWAKLGSCGFPCYTPDGKWILSTNQTPIALPLNDAGTALAENGKPWRIYYGPTGCNHETSHDGQWLTWTIDTFGEAGGWICHAPLNMKDANANKPVKARLGWPEASVNYDSCFSPCDKYLVYMHGEIVKGKRSYDGVPSEIYATRFPPDGVNARLTWQNAAARHPHWVTESGAWK